MVHMAAIPEVYITANGSSLSEIFRPARKAAPLGILGLSDTVSIHARTTQGTRPARTVNISRQFPSTVGSVLKSFSKCLT